MAIAATVSSLLGLAVGAYLLARRVLRLEAGAVRFVGAVVIVWAWLTVGVIGLGSFGAIGAGGFVAWSAALATVGIVGGALGRDPEPSHNPETSGTFGWASVMAVALTGLAVLWGGVPSLLFPVKVVSDGPIYHLYFAARWWQSGRLDLIPTPFGENAAPYFAAVGDLWFTWLMTLSGGDRLARIGQIPFLAVCAVAGYRLCRDVGVGKDAAVVAVCWALSSTPFLAFGMEANVDTIFVAGYLLMCLFLLRWAMGRQPTASLALGALAAGLAWGTKPTGIVFVPPILLLAAIRAILHDTTPSRKVRDVLLLATLPLVGEGFWLARNAWLTGNPLYPLHVQIGSATVFQGWYGSEVMKLSQYYLEVTDWRAFWDILLAVLDPRFVPFWVLSLLGGWNLSRRSEIRAGWVWIASGLVVLNLALYWVGIPYRTQQRFMFQGMFLAVVPLGALLDPARWRRWLGVGLLAAHLLTSQEWPFAQVIYPIPWDLSPYIPNAIDGWLAPIFTGSVGPSLVVQGIALVGVSWLFLRSKTWRGHVLGALGALAIVGGSIGVVLVSAGGITRLPPYPGFRDYYNAWLDLDQRTRGNRYHIAYAGTNLPYYLMGRDFRHRVEYINVDENPDWLLHDYHSRAIELGEKPTWDHPRPGWDRQRQDYAAWLANLRTKKIQLLVVARANPDEGPHNLADAERFTIERIWADAHPEVFEPIYGVNPPDLLIKIYRVKPPA